MNEYLSMMRTQVSWADRTDDPSAVQYGILLALASIAESLDTPAAENRPVEANETGWQQEFEHALDLLRDVLGDIPADLTSPAIDVARNMLDIPGAVPVEFVMRAQTAAQVNESPTLDEQGRWLHEPGW
jgi:hypothetical protein